VRVRADSSVGSAPVCVLGDVDLVRALGLAGLSSVVVAGPDDPVRYSRHVVGTLAQLDHWTQADDIVAQLVTWAGTQQGQPVLIPQTDGDLLLVSRHRAALSAAFRFVVAEEALVEDLIHKQRFQALAQRSGLDVPPAAVMPADGAANLPRGLRLPVIAKPLTRRDLVGLDLTGKAVRIDGEADFRELRRRTSAQGIDVLVQELVPGPETRMESWHAYVDGEGAIAGEFCGQKIRTWPLEFGYSTAVRITATADVACAGREVAERLGLHGLIKVDFKRDPAGVLRLLEVNPRATLWNFPGAVAGVNLVALLHADLIGRPRPPVPPLRAGVTWCAPREDRWAAAAAGVSTTAWLAQMLRCSARSGASWDDPAPFVRGELAPAVKRRLRRVRGGRVAGLRRE